MEPLTKTEVASWLLNKALDGINDSRTKTGTEREQALSEAFRHSVAGWVLTEASDAQILSLWAQYRQTRNQ